MAIKCWADIVKFGAMDVLRRQYGEWLSDEIEEGFDVTLKLELDKFPQAGGPFFFHRFTFGSKSELVRFEPTLLTEQQTELIHSLSLLKPTAFSAPFERAFHAQAEIAPPSEGESAQPSELMQIHYREDEAIYIQAAHDRVTVIFSTVFKEETDRVFGRVFLQVRGKRSFSMSDRVDRGFSLHLFLRESRSL